LLDATASLLGPVGLFTNLVEIIILLLGWIIVVIAFFILAIQVFVTIIEFKLVTLAGFILVPFAFFGRTAFMAEKVLGHIISSGIKLLVLGVITGIGSGLFSQFTDAGLGTEPTADQVMAIALAALTLVGLAIFAPGVANGIVAGGPQLGAGAAAGTALAVGATMAGGVAGARIAAGAAGSAALGGAKAMGTAQAAYGAGAAGGGGMAGGLAGVAKAAGSAATSPLRKAASAMKEAHGAGRSGAGQTASAGTAAGQPAPGAGDGAPEWARKHKRGQTVREGASMLTHTLPGGDSHGGGASVDLGEKE
jgi:type IV secretion system protein TrbL